MSATKKQIEANRENSQRSTGPTTEAGLQRSSLNATVHGFTGQTLVLTTGEKDAYAAYVQHMLEEHAPCNAEARELLYSYIDLRWSLQQIAVQQNNVIAIMNAITEHHMASGDLAAMNADLEPHTRRLRTLGTYEQRRRKAANDTLEQFQQLQQQHAEARELDLQAAAEACISFKKLDQPFDPQQLGFVHALPEIEQFLARKERALFIKMIMDEAKTATD